MVEPIITMTEAAVKRAKSLMTNADADIVGLRIGISLSLIHI